ALMVCMTFFPSNLSFYDFANLDEMRFRRMMNLNNSPTLRVILSGPGDPIIEKVISLLSTAISIVKIDSFSLSSLAFSLCEQLLRSSTIGALKIQLLHLNDTTAPLALSIASHAKEIEINHPLNQLSDP
ncbi:hypothetical protein PMAYCL1PPCAC_08348, partial [Pristionchus mayeri]